MVVGDFNNPPSPIGKSSNKHQENPGNHQRPLWESIFQEIGKS
jgi:hypothetical protein